MSENERLLWRIEDLANQLGLSQRKIYRMIDEGCFKAVKIGRARRITDESVRAWLRAATGGPEPTDEEADRATKAVAKKQLERPPPVCGVLDTEWDEAEIDQLCGRLND